MSCFQIGDKIQTKHIENRRELFLVPPNEKMDGKFGTVIRILDEKLMPIVVIIDGLDWAYNPQELILIERPEPLPFDN